MFARVSSIIGSTGRRLRQNADGSIATTFALALIPMVGLVGAAVDYARANNIKTGLQAALDSAILAGARDNTANWTNVALNVFNGTFQPKGSSTDTPSFALNANGTFTASVNGIVPTAFMGVFGVSAMNINASATAMVAPTSPSEQYCLLALNLTANPSVQVTGNGSITITAP